MSLLRVVSAALLLALAACGESHTEGKPVPPPVMRDAGGDAMPDGDAGATCSAPQYLAMELVNDESNISIGWTGLTFDTSVPSGSKLAVEVTGCDDDCVSNCQFRGPVDLPDAESLRRCTNNTSIKCESDAGCPGAACAYYLASHSISSLILGFENSLLIQFKETDDENDRWPVRGSIDLNTGRVDIDRVNLRFTLYVGALTASCEGDGTPFDGNPEGHCVGNTPARSCDVNGVPGVGPNVVHRDTSLDCPLPNLNGTDTYFDLDLGHLNTVGETIELSADSPTCSLDGQKCWCGICNDSSRKACQNNRECGGDVTCGAGMAPVARTRRDGCNINPFMTSTTTCGDKAGPRCFLGYDSILSPRCHLGNGQLEAKLTVEGEQKVEDNMIRSSIAGITCIPETNNDQINAQAGLPGSAVIKLGTRTTPYASDGSIWHLPQ